MVSIYGTWSILPKISFGGFKGGGDSIVGISGVSAEISYDSFTRTKNNNLGKYKESLK